VTRWPEGQQHAGHLPKDGDRDLKMRNDGFESLVRHAGLLH